MKPVLENTDTLVFVSGITADRSRPVLRAVDYLRSQGYHELVSRSTVIVNHTDQITDKDALAYLTERFTKVGATVERCRLIRTSPKAASSIRFTS